MPKVIRAKYEKCVLKPLEPLELDDGEEVLVELDVWDKVLFVAVL